LRKRFRSKNLETFPRERGGGAIICLFRIKCFETFAQRGPLFEVKLRSNYFVAFLQKGAIKVLKFRRRYSKAFTKKAVGVRRRRGVGRGWGWESGVGRGWRWESGVGRGWGGGSREGVGGGSQESGGIRSQKERLFSRLILEANIFPRFHGIGGGCNRGTAVISRKTAVICLVKLNLQNLNSGTIT